MIEKVSENWRIFVKYNGNKIELYWIETEIEYVRFEIIHDYIFLIF